MKVLRHTDKASPHQVRRANTQLVLQQVSEGRGQVSRADLVRLTGLNTATISSVVSDLLENGLVIETGVGPSAGGKPPVLLDIDHARHSVLALQVASTGYRLAELTLRGDVRRELHGVLDAARPAKVVARSLARAVSAFIDPDRVTIALGVAVPGLVDGTGVVTKSVTLGWTGFDLRAALADRIDLPIHLINDSRSAAFAEVSLTDEKSPSLMALYVGDGVGAGLVLQGRLFTGDDFTAGEVGHVNLRTHDLQCACGRTGCLEAAATLQVLTGQTAPRFGDPAPPPAKVDRRAGRRAARNIGVLMELNHDLLGIGQTVLCGPVCNLGPVLLDLIQDELGLSELFLTDRISVRLSELGDRGALLGAAAFAVHEELSLLWTSRPASAT